MWNSLLLQPLSHKQPPWITYHGVPHMHLNKQHNIDLCVCLDVTAVYCSIIWLPLFFDGGPTFWFRLCAPILHSKTFQPSYSALSNSMWLKSYGLLKLEHSISSEIKDFMFQIARVHRKVGPLHGSIHTNMHEWILFCSSEVLLLYLKIQSHVLY